MLCPAFHAQTNNHALVFEPIQSYEADEAIVEIGRPRYLDQDPQGNLYALDVQGRQVHIWDAKGKYRRSFGQKGEGPGEFMFTYPVGEIVVYQGHIIVVDESVAKIHFFDKNTGKFKRTIPRPSNLSRLRLYRAESGRSLFALNVSGSRAVQEVVKLNLEMEVENVFFSIPYGRTEWLDKVRYIYRPQANRLMFCPFQDNLLIAETRDNALRVFDQTGQKQKTVRIPMAQDEVEEEEKQAYRKQYLQGSYRDRVRLEFHEKGSFFDLVLSVDGLILVMKNGDERGHLSGIALDHQFRRLTSFHESFGEVVHISAIDGRIITITVPEDGEYQITAYTVRLERRREPTAGRPDYN
ncbi:MAG: hypothetical protein QNK37_24305 [Acidobacteriota bacterium]|nr:hypothetical protein [Acidobacteriota bacterium]